MSSFEALETETVFEGRIFEVKRARVRYEDGGEATREFVTHGGAVAIVAYDDDQLWLVRQPREAIERTDVLELPAGRLDREGEPPLDTAKRELAEELGLEAAEWQHATTYYSSSGFTNEEVHVFFATGLSEVAERPEVEEDERIEVVTWPLDQIDGAIEATTDAKTLIGLLWLRRARQDDGGAGTGA
jgi:ADP-ribose pyrophosphatase